MALNQINLDSIKFNFYNITPNSVRQGEKGIILPVGLTSNNVGVKNLNDVDLSFEATKPDKKIILDEDQTHFKKYDGYFEYTLPTEIYQAVGDVTGHFILKYDNQVIDTTSDFSIKVLPRTGQDEYSSDYISQAEKIVEYAKNQLDEINKISKIGTAQIELTKNNLTKNVNDFIEDKKNNIDSNLSNYYAQLNQLINTFKTNINANQQQFTTKKNEIDTWFSNQQSTIIAKYKQIDSDWNTKKAEKDTDWQNLKTSYNNQIANLTKQYQNSVDEQKTKLSNDLNEFKNNLKSQVSDLQNTIKNLNENKVPELNDRLSKIQKAINDIDLESVKRKSDDAYSMADSTAKKVDEFDSRIESKATATSVYSWQVTDLKISQANSRVISQANSYTDNKVANAKPDLSNYYSKEETYNREQIDNKNLASQQQATTIIKQEFGDKANLNTEEKSNLVNAINWLWSKINGAFDLSSPVVPYVNDSANYTNQNMIYLNNSGSYNFDSSHTISYDSNFANATLSNIGDGLKLWVKLRKRPYTNGVQQADILDYPISYSSSDYVSGQYSTSVQSPIIINKSDIAVNSSSESKTIIVELVGVGELKTGSKLSPKLKITNNGNANNLLIESIQGYNFDNPNSSTVNGGYYDIDIERVAEFEILKSPVSNLVNGYLMFSNENDNQNYLMNVYNLTRIIPLSQDFSKVKDGIKIKINFDFSTTSINDYNMIYKVSNENIIVSPILKNLSTSEHSYYIFIPKKELINNNSFYLFSDGANSFYININANVKVDILNNQIRFSVSSFANSSLKFRVLEVKNYIGLDENKNKNILFSPKNNAKTGQQTINLDKKIDDLNNGLLFKFDSMYRENVPTKDINEFKRAFLPSENCEIYFESFPNLAVVKISKESMKKGIIATKNTQNAVPTPGNSWLFKSQGGNISFDFNREKYVTLTLNNAYNDVTSYVTLVEIQEY